jgi:hypothetical protein
LRKLPVLDLIKVDIQDGYIGLNESPKAVNPISVPPDCGFHQKAAALREIVERKAQTAIDITDIIAIFRKLMSEFGRTCQPN